MDENKIAKEKIKEIQRRKDKFQELSNLGLSESTTNDLINMSAEYPIAIGDITNLLQALNEEMDTVISNHNHLCMYVEELSKHLKNTESYTKWTNRLHEESKKGKKPDVSIKKV